MQDLKELLEAVEEIKEQYHLRDAHYLKVCNSMKKVSDQYSRAFDLDQADDTLPDGDGRKTYKVYVTLLNPVSKVVNEQNKDGEIELKCVEVSYVHENFTFLTKFKPCACGYCAKKGPRRGSRPTGECPFKAIYEGSRTGAFYRPCGIYWRAFETLPAELQTKLNDHKVHLSKEVNQGFVRAERLVFIDTCEADPDEEQFVCLDVIYWVIKSDYLR